MRQVALSAEGRLNLETAILVAAEMHEPYAMNSHTVSIWMRALLLPRRWLGEVAAKGGVWCSMLIWRVYHEARLTCGDDKRGIYLTPASMAVEGGALDELLQPKIGPMQRLLLCE